MSKVCLAALFVFFAATATRAQEKQAEESPDPSVEITADAASLSPEPTPTPHPPIRITTAAARNADGKPETKYRSSAPNIFVRWRGENLPVGAVVRVAWIAEDVGDIVDPNFVIDRDETVVPSPTFSARFTISRPSDGWAPGKYRVDLFVDDVLRDTLGITIGD